MYHALLASWFRRLEVICVKCCYRSTATYRCGRQYGLRGLIVKVVFVSISYCAVHGGLRLGVNQSIQLVPAKAGGSGSSKVIVREIGSYFHLVARSYGPPSKGSPFRGSPIRGPPFRGAPCKIRIHINKNGNKAISANNKSS